MNWLARLKAENSSTTRATTAQSVAFVAPIAEAIPKTQADPVAALPKHAPSPVQATAKATNATNTPRVAFVALPPSEKAKAEDASAVHPQMLAPQRQPSTLAEAPADADSVCWPYSKAMNTQEIDTFARRLEQFTHKGVSLPEAELMADQLMRRDREDDDRRLCLECIHLHGDMGRWRCANGLVAGVTLYTANTPLAKAMTQQLQRCPGFASCASKKEPIDEQQ
ncbi:hypothetical protein HS961_17380 [Comamonas piscis]|uniref:Uncharacterized protein n=1 Tax=Comamonas piscis TaxID=1562974 RepID=A0A7G5EKD7_9BURK|nr:hypothetical protein [Comamonas piscis]QMV74462.1 hypothetical protein HS961_17380 [Comamonas piscis]WSO32916.1 hypothetical protein VUJ63_17435 [Comamonas piscis]